MAPLAIAQLVVTLLPMIMKLMGIAETALEDKPKSGPEKKRLVMDGTEAILMGVKGVSTGGQAETWERIEEPVSGLVDNLTTLMYPKDRPSIFDRINGLAAKFRCWTARFCILRDGWQVGHGVSPPWQVAVGVLFPL